VALRLFAIISLVSLLLCLTITALWGRSYSECVTFMGTGWVKSWEGEIECVQMLEFSGPAESSENGNLGADVTPDPPKPIEYHVQPVGKLMVEPTAFGFGRTHGTRFFMQDDRFYASSWQCYVVPYWVFVTATALLPVLWVANQRRLRRKAARLAAANAPPQQIHVT